MTKTLSGISGGAVIQSDNISFAWGAALCRLLQRGVTAITPMVINITGFDLDSGPAENIEIRKALDDFKSGADLWSVEDVAFTIFPQVYWELAQGDRQTFYQDYLDAAPLLRCARATGQMRSDNHKGIYFERLVAYGNDGDNHHDCLNQLETIIQNYQAGNHRKSMMQATTYDPYSDLNNQPILGFPCLQQVSFVDEENDTLAINAFYAMQYLVPKAYGNILGLTHLGQFMAHALGKKLGRITMYAGVEQLGGNGIQKTNPKIKNIEELVKTQAPKETLDA